MISFDEFKKLEIRIGKVVVAEKIADAQKLIKLTFDMGGETRGIVAGIADFFPDVSLLIGKEMPVMVNLEPKNFRGHTSYGMILAADVDGRPVLLHPAEDVPPGSIVR